MDWFSGVLSTGKKVLYEQLFSHDASGSGVDDRTITETFLGSNESSSPFLTANCFASALSRR